MTAETAALEGGTFRSELRELLGLAMPIALAQLGLMALGVVDTAVVGRLGERELGGVGLGNAVFFTMGLFGAGLLLGFDPLIAQAIGAERKDRARALMWQGTWVAGVVTVPVALATSLIAHALDSLGVEPATAALAARYVDARLLGLPPFLAFMVVRVFLQAHGLTRPMLVSVVVANVINAPLAWLLVHGDHGLVRIGLPGIGVPALGVLGAGLASTVVAFIQLAIVGNAALAVERGSHPWRPKPREWRAPLGLGVPAGLQRLAEAGAFSITGVLMARLGTLSVAAHQVAITLSSVTFMACLGLSAAASVRVGHAIGRGDVAHARRAGLVALVVAAAYMLGCGVAFALAPRVLARFLTDQEAIVLASGPLIFVAAVFQISDGLQVVATGALRGVGDTTLPLVLNLVGYYALGLPIGMLLAYELGLGGVGLWWGLCIGLSVVAIALTLRFARVTRGSIAALEI